MTEGKPFWIRCKAEPPINWFKDGERIEKHLIRHGNENFTYSVKDLVLEDLKKKIESTLTISKAALRHKGKYQCNVNYNSSYFVHVHPAPTVMDEEMFISNLGPDEDHEEERMRFETPIESDKAMPSTMMRFTTPPVTQSTQDFVESLPDFDFETPLSEEMTREDQNEVVYEESIDERIREEIIEKKNFPQENFITFPEQPDITDDVLSTAFSSPEITSLTNIPHHMRWMVTTHSYHVVHTTHAIPSEVQTQNHPDKHRHKGSQKNDEEMIRKSFFF